MKITPGYLEQNRALHAVGNYGLSGQRWAPTVLNVCKLANSRDVLDYGCGRRTLERTLGWPIRNYDPVICTDVLEHVEPECLDEVLDDLRRVTRKVGFFVIATRPAKKLLPDGRNAHLIQESLQWWLPKLQQRFTVSQLQEMNGEFCVVVGPLAAG
jgi:hypothetical protein